MNSRKKTLSVILIVNNEEKNLASCLDTIVEWADEIIILDSGSTDETLKIAGRYTKKIFQNTAWSGFGPQRRLAQSYASCDFILWLDADEQVSPELKHSINEVLDNPERNAIYAIPRLSSFLGQPIRHSGWYPDYVVRFYPTALTMYNDAVVHEKVIIPDGTTVRFLKGDILHHPYIDLESYAQKSITYANAWARQNHGKGKDPGIVLGILHALAKFATMYIIHAGFLDGRHGLLLAVLSSYATFLKYARLWSENHRA